MLLVISSRVTPDVAPTTSALTKALEAEILQMSAKIASTLSSIILFPTILDPNVASLKDSVTYKNGERSVFVAVSIPYGRWKNASERDRIDLLADNVRDSIEKIPNRYIQISDKTALLHIVEKSRDALKRQI